MGITYLRKGAAGVKKLSELEIDVSKDWRGYLIRNVGAPERDGDVYVRGSSIQLADIPPIDHGWLTGLGDDDHTQYALANRTRPSPWAKAPYRYIVDEIDGSVAVFYENGVIAHGPSTSPATEINWALANLTSGRTWKEKVLVKGNYTINAPIEIPSYTILEIQGKIKVANGANCNAIQNSDLTNGNEHIEIFGGEVDANWENQTLSNDAIRMNKVSYVWVHHCLVRGGRRAADADLTAKSGEGIAFSYCHYGLISNNIAHDSYYDDIKVYYGDHIDTVGNVCYGASQSSGGIQYGMATRGAIVGNVVYKTGTGEAGRGIKLHSANRISVVGNEVYADTYGIDLIDQTRDVVISGNFVEASVGLMVRLGNCYRFIAVGNRFYRAYGGTGVQLDYGTECAIINNLITGADGANMTNGIIIGTNCSNVLVEGNKFAYVTTPITNNGTNTIIKRNVGYATENGETAIFSGDGSTTTFNIPHGLASTPKVYSVQKASDITPNIKYVTADATNLTVVFDSAPPAGTNNVVLSWKAEV